MSYENWLIMDYVEKTNIGNGSAFRTKVALRYQQMRSSKAQNWQYSWPILAMISLIHGSISLHMDSMMKPRELFTKPGMLCIKPRRQAIHWDQYDTFILKL